MPAGKFVMTPWKLRDTRRESYRGNREAAECRHENGVKYNRPLRCRHTGSE